MACPRVKLSVVLGFNQMLDELVSYDSSPCGGYACGH